MKSIINAAMAGLIILSITACSETEERLDNRIEIIYENNSNKGIMNPSLLDDNLISVERIGCDHEIAREIRGEISSSGLKSADTNPGSLKRFKFNYTECNLYSMGGDDVCGRSILYEYDGLYLTAYASFEQTDEHIRLFELRSTDGELCFSMELSASNKIGEVKIVDNDMFNNFRSSIMNRENLHGMQKGAAADYCRQSDSWSSCFSCTMDYCASRWYCSMAVAIYPMEFIAGIAASCIGAGPGAAG